jgi:RNA polymerase sigma-70 factor (ECF subfamily)
LETSVPQSINDPQFIARLQAGDNNAFKSLISTYHPKLLIVARAIAGDVFAEDVTQEAWASIYKAIAKFEGRSSLSTWMIQIVSNEAKSRLRREKRHSSYGDMDEIVPAVDPDNFNSSGHWSNPPSHWDINTPELMLQEDQLRQCIEHTLTVLPENQKAVFLLRDVEQSELSSIAETLIISEANVRVLLHRARLRLTATINHYQETGEC